MENKIYILLNNGHVYENIDKIYFLTFEEETTLAIMGDEYPELGLRINVKDIAVVGTR